ncbi:hypothetical protein PG997_013371, partial [Apiospora hydei]
MSRFMSSLLLIVGLIAVALIRYIRSLEGHFTDVMATAYRSYEGSLTSTMISLLGTDVYVFQGQETISRIIRHPNLSSPMALYVFGQRFMFGMPKRGVSAYIADDSGPSAKPLPGSHVAPERRVDYLLHKAFNQAWAGRSMPMVSRRFMDLLVSHTDSLGIKEDWTDIGDFYKFFGKPVSTAVTEAIFGPSLLQLNPDLIENSWSFDKVLPLAVLPSSFIFDVSSLPFEKNTVGADSEMRFTESSIYPDGDGDPFWGSEIIRHLQQELLQHGSRGFIDDECLAAHDMGLIWGVSGCLTSLSARPPGVYANTDHLPRANSNVIAAAMLAAFHVFQDLTLLRRVRDEIESSFPQPFSMDDVTYKQLWELPLLSSIHAEVLRLYVNVFLMFSSPHEDVDLGRWRLPKGKTALVSTAIAHRNESIWNTKDGMHPSTPSGPTASFGALKQGMKAEHNDMEGDRAYFSTQGLDGSWVPFGGGPTMCPGRFIAKTVMMSTCALL